jgi:hypothetical protein
MVSKPAVISHPSSFKLCQDFYTSFMKHNASTNISDVEALIKSEPLKKYFENIEQGELPQLLRELSQTNRIESAEEFLLMSYKEIVTTNSTGELNE